MSFPDDVTDPLAKATALVLHGGRADVDLLYVRPDAGAGWRPAGDDATAGMPLLRLRYSTATGEATIQVWGGRGDQHDDDAAEVPGGGGDPGTGGGGTGGTSDPDG
jgi:hypothetical protein